MKIKVGFGFDVHQLKDGLDFWLGGIKVPHTKGGLGHSDADVLIHAICDALLGSANLGDIGKHFPDSSEEFKGIDSKILLKEVVKMISERGYSIGNIDSTVCLQKPKIGPYIPEMQKVLASCMNIDSEDISIKATTTEGLGFIGRNEGIAVMSNVMIYI